ncbi:MAG: sn-glycerol-3-phosphate ABC transporter ATP-binding protein UgpC [bacterium]
MIRKSEMSKVILENVNKVYPNDVHAVKDVSLEVPDGELLVLVGPSGCGKSTVLRMIAGLEKISSGKILIGDKVVNDLEPKYRDVAMVFQDYALYPHMSVKENLEFGLVMRKVPREVRGDAVGKAAKILGLSELLERKPAQLSGGQKQRVAVGRAIVREPKVFLFDEPLSNLDATLRAEMRTEIAKLHQRLGVTTVYVTHDQVEAMTLGQRIVMMENGFVRQVGPPLEVYENPVNKFVGGFLGTPPMNFIDGKITNIEKGFSFGEHALPVPSRYRNLPESKIKSSATYGIRPEHINLLLRNGNKWDGGIPGEIVVVEPLGSRAIVIVKIGDKELTAEVEPIQWMRAGAPALIKIDESKGHLFDNNGVNLSSI